MIGPGPPDRRVPGLAVAWVREIEGLHGLWRREGADSIRPWALRAGGRLGEEIEIETASPRGERAPDFTLEDQDGRAITLSSFQAHAPVVLVFYRGHW